MSQSKSKNSQRIPASLALIAISAFIIGTVVVTEPKSTPAENKAPAPNVSVPAPSTSAAPAQPAAVSQYKDGSYRATGIYISPAGQESLGVSLTLNDDIVTASSVQSGANDPTASVYQQSFISGYKKYVVGKKVNSIRLANVSGSSLTSQGFNDALQQIEEQAKA
jgi:uncharacterized protein with FMN-binding domain